MPGYSTWLRAFGRKHKDLLCNAKPSPLILLRRELYDCPFYAHLVSNLIHNALQSQRFVDDIRSVHFHRFLGQSHSAFNLDLAALRRTGVD